MSKVSFVEIKPNQKIPALAPGDTVRVHNRIVEGEKERVQVFQGVVIRIKRGGAGASFTVRRVAHGVGIERTFPLYSPLLEKVEVTRHGKVRRARLYYLRGLSAKKARIKERRVIEKPGAEIPEVEAALEAAEAEIDEEVTAEVTEEAAAEVEAEPTVQAEAETEPAVQAEAETEPVVQAEAETEPAVQAGVEAEPVAEAEAKPATEEEGPPAAKE